MMLFRGRGTPGGTVISAIVFVAVAAALHIALGLGFGPILFDEARLPFALLLCLSFGFIATIRLAGATRFVLARQRRWVGVDDTSIVWTDGERVVEVTWTDIEEVRVHFVRVQDRIVSYVTVETRRGERFALSHHFQGRIQERQGGVPADHAVLDVEMTPFLLWMMKERAGLSEVEPFVWRRGAPTVVVVEQPPTDEEMQRRIGVPSARLLSPVQVGLALLSFLIYVTLGAARFGPRIAVLLGLLLVVLLLFHELGHVWAMRRCGMRVRGVYFIPFLGAATVPETLWRDRDALAYTSLSGPLWGVLGSLPLLLAWYATGGKHSELLGIVLLNAVLNLANLLPIPPLDGSRVLTSILSSISPELGLSVGVGMLLLTLGAAIAIGGWPSLLLGALAIVGTFEVLSQYSAAVEAEKVRRLVPPGAWTEEVARFGDMLSLMTLEEYAWTKAGGAPRRVGRWMRWQQVLGCEPMRPGRIALYTVAYFSLAGVLVAGLVAARALF